jgi:hypothetical protein
MNNPVEGGNYWPTVALTLALLSPAAPAQAQGSSPPELPPECRQFDFWVGDWNVTEPDGKPAGTNSIELVAGGAGLLEHWTGYPVPAGGTGKSLNAFKRAKTQWQQFWIGSGGGVLELSGGLVDGSMVLTGEHDVAGRRLRERITWTPLPDGTVRQHWQQSADGGKVWRTVFDGLYRKKPAR